jgi:membrane-bound ClpP family serine protease
MKMSGRLVVAIVSTAAEETAIALLGLLVLPQFFDVHIPTPLLAVIMVAWLGWSFFIYRKGSGALRRRPVGGLSDMKGMKGTVVRVLKPNGLVRVHGELWESRSVGETIEPGSRVVVVAQEGLRLVVRPDDSLAGAASVEEG